MIHRHRRITVAAISPFSALTLLASACGGGGNTAAAGEDGECTPPETPVLTLAA